MAVSLTGLGLLSTIIGTASEPIFGQFIICSRVTPRKTETDYLVLWVSETRNPKPKTQNPIPKTQNLIPETQNPKPET